MVIWKLRYLWFLLGLFSSIMRELANITHDGPKWILLDGDIDPMWIESLNTVMDDNKVPRGKGSPMSSPVISETSSPGTFESLDCTVGLALSKELLLVSFKIFGGALLRQSTYNIVIIDIKHCVRLRYTT